jgi:hypothetical protein
MYIFDVIYKFVQHFWSFPIKTLIKTRLEVAKMYHFKLKHRDLLKTFQKRRTKRLDQVILKNDKVKIFLNVMVKSICVCLIFTDGDVCVSYRSFKVFLWWPSCQTWKRWYVTWFAAVGEVGMIWRCCCVCTVAATKKIGVLI